MIADWNHTNPAQLLATHVGRPGNTGRSYRGDLDCFGEFLGIGPEDAVRALIDQPRGSAKRQLDDFANWLRAKYSLNTARRRLGCLLGLLRLAHEYDIVPWAIRNYPLPSPEPIRDTRGPDRSDVEAMIAACQKRGDAKGARDLCIMRLMSSCALRANEVLRLDVKHIDVKARELMIMSKGMWGTRPTRFPFTVKTGMAICNWLDVRGVDDGPLFLSRDRAIKEPMTRLGSTGLYDVIKTLGRKAGVENMHPHGLRHYAATEFLRMSNGNVAWAMALTRHKDPRTLIVYNDERMTHAREAMEIVERGVPVFNQNDHDSDNF
jgi:integrase/recombinase XerC